jgi:hypothetical protein
MAEKKITPSVLVTHIGGLNSVISTTLNLPNIPGGKKLIYTHIDLEMTSIKDFKKLGERDPRFLELHKMVEGSDGLWSIEAEKYLLKNF